MYLLYVFRMAEKQKCKYWEKCFRKEKKHLETFLHPADEKKENKGKKTPQGMIILIILYSVFLLTMKSAF